MNEQSKPECHPRRRFSTKATAMAACAAMVSRGGKQRLPEPCPEPEYPGQDGKLKGVKDGAADGKKKQKEMEAQL